MLGMIFVFEIYLEFGHLEFGSCQLAGAVEFGSIKSLR